MLSSFAQSVRRSLCDLRLCYHAGPRNLDRFILSNSWRTRPRMFHVNYAASCWVVHGIGTGRLLTSSYCIFTNWTAFLALSPATIRSYLAFLSKTSSPSRCIVAGSCQRCSALMLATLLDQPGGTSKRPLNSMKLEVGSNFATNITWPTVGCRRWTRFPSFGSSTARLA
jgi:hypothetical protein